MAKVNQGLLNFSDVSTTDTILDMLRVFYQQTNTSREMVNKKIGEINYTTNKYRSTGSEQVVSAIANAEDFETPDKQMKMLGNMSSRSDLHKLMQFISKVDKMAVKKALVIRLMSYGLHILMRDDFHLVADIRETYDPSLQQLNDDYIQQINNDNKFINKAIDDFYSYASQDIEDAEALLYDFIKAELGEKALELAKSYGYYMKTGGSSNLVKAFAPYMMKSGTDEVDPDIQKRFSEVLTVYRSIISSYERPSIGELQSHFNISSTTYRNNLADGLALIKNSMPESFLSRVI